MSKFRPSGGYRTTCSFQTATIVYDATYWFCGKFLDSRSRTVDQMVQAARSGRQNIAEGSRAAATSSQTELRLLNVARSSLEELLLDYEDFLRHRHLPQWTPDAPEALAVRQVPQKFKQDQPDQSDLADLTDHERWALYAPWLEHADPAVRATRPSASFTRPTTSWTSRSPRSKGGSSQKAATANNSPPPDSPSGSGGKLSPIGPIRPIPSPPAPSAPNLWSSAPPRAARTPASSSGVAPPTRTAKEP